MTHEEFRTAMKDLDFWHISTRGKDMDVLISSVDGFQYVVKYGDLWDLNYHLTDKTGIVKLLTSEKAVCLSISSITAISANLNSFQRAGAYEGYRNLNKNWNENLIKQALNQGFFKSIIKKFKRR